MDLKCTKYYSRGGTMRRNHCVSMLLMCLVIMVTSGLSFSATTPKLEDPATSMTSKEEAIEKARGKAAEIHYSLIEHVVEAKEIDGAWEVDFMPADPNSLGGGLKVVIDKETGEIVSTKYQQ